MDKNLPHDQDYISQSDVTAMLMNAGHLGDDYTRAFQTVRVWVHRGKLPDPDLVSGGKKLWRPDTIQEWIGLL